MLVIAHPSTETDQEVQGISGVKSHGHFYALNLISTQVQVYWPSYPTINSSLGNNIHLFLQKV